MKEIGEKQERAVFANFGRNVALVAAYILFSNIFYNHEVGALGTLLRLNAVLLLILAFFLDKAFFAKAKKLISYLVFLILFADLTLIFRASPFIQFLFSVSLFATGVFLTFFLVNKIAGLDSLLDAVFTPLRTIKQYIEGGLASARFFLSSEYRSNLIGTKHEGKSARTISLIIGFGIAVPIVLVILFLLTSADPIFATYTKKLFENIPGRLIYSGFILGSILPIMFLRRSKFSSIYERIPKGRHILEYLPVAGLTTLTLAAFLIIQAPYVFVKVAAETDLSRFGVATYSEYVTRGFFELLIVSFIVYILLWVGLLTIRKSEEKKPLLKNIQLVLLVELLVFVFSIFRRVYLYFNLHGLTLIRIYGSIFLVALALMILTLGARYFSKKKWIAVEVAALTFCLIFIGLFNAERFILANPPTVNKRVDYMYLSRLSADGYGGWTSSLAHAEKILDETKYKDKKIISKPERREIAYSSFMVWQQLENYHSLTLTYADEKELAAYYKKIIDSEVAIREDYKNRYKAKSGEEDSGGSDWDWQIRANEDNLKNLKEAAKTKNYSRVYPQPYYFPYTNLFSNATFNFPSLYSVEPKPTSQQWFSEGGRQEKKRKRLSRLFNYNIADKNAFEKMQKEMPIEKLLEVYRQYLKLHEKIMQQVSTEREFDMDISLQSPLL